MLNASSRHSQHGAGALAVVLLLVFAASLALLHLNRSAVVEQRAAVHQTRSSAAFELAEAGLAWAIGMLNSPLKVGADCRPDADAGTSFRQRYVGPWFHAGTAPATAAASPVLRCRFVDPAGGTGDGREAALGDGLDCLCSAAGDTAAAAQWHARAGHSAAFAVVLDPVTASTGNELEPGTVRVTAVGCPFGCPADASPSLRDGRDLSPEGQGLARVTALLRHLPSLRTAPAAAVTCGGDCDLDTSGGISNLDLRTAGLHAVAGGALRLGSTPWQTLPGQPMAAAVSAQDPALADATADAQCTQGALIRSLTGRPFAELVRPGGEVLTLSGCDDPAACARHLSAALQAGWRSFHFPQGLRLDASFPMPALGTPEDGVRLYAAGPVRIESALTVHGLVYLHSPDPRAMDLGPAQVNGAVTTCGAWVHRGSGQIRYSSAALGARSLGHGAMVRVPGSWRDF
jgi:hypothetical protein